MGYQTWFDGELTITPPLTAEQVAEINYFADLRHDDYGGGDRGRREAVEPTVDWPKHNNLPYGDETPDDTCPGAWCDWEVSEDGTALIWNESEKFYNWDEWLRLLVKFFIVPWERRVDGAISWNGDDGDDRGTIYARWNEIQVVPDEIKNPGPSWVSLDAKNLHEGEPGWLNSDHAEGCPMLNGLDCTCGCHAFKGTAPGWTYTKENGWERPPGV